MDFKDFHGRGFFFLLDIKTEQRLFTATCGRRGGRSVQPGDARWTRRSWVKKGRWGNAKYGPGVQSMLLPGGPLTVMPGGPRRPRSPFISSYWIPSRPTWGKVLENYIWVPDTNCNSWLGGFWNINGKLSWCWKSEKIFYRQDTVFMFLLLLRLPAEFGDFLEILQRLDVKILWQKTHLEDFLRKVFIS